MYNLESKYGIKNVVVVKLGIKEWMEHESDGINLLRKVQVVRYNKEIRSRR